MKAKVIELANQYVGLAGRCADALAEQFDVPDILEAVHSSTMPRQGEFKAFGGGSYFVHGSGCRIEAREVEIDFDFGPSGSVPCFDPWKLYNFARNHHEANPWLPERSVFERLIAELLSEGSLKRLATNPNPQLLCLKRED